ncbi:helix-turn-helix transcriptional regulator [Cellulomonas sp. RIT-PI-Y]|uniref:helix-turn-helix domain-containing protein n=1 Tax=Cellulomonas sp. RIT-PI-Y TaxID=3035297 RepID=UPI0021D8298B|nr:helix-turn-helix transcriptional regulator [Cellulomonas sp. RIT-PI-Y]
MTTMGDRVRQARVAAQISQTALAGDKLSPSYVSLIESGRREPTDAALAVLAERLGLTVEYLKFGDEGPAEAQARLALDYAQLDLVSGEFGSAVERLRGLDLSVVTRPVRIKALLALANAHEKLGDLEQSVTILEPLVKDLRESGDTLDLATAATALAGDYIESGDLARAGEIGDAAMSDLEDAGLVGTDEHLRLGSTLIWVNVARGDLLYATQRAAELIREADRLGTPRGRGSVYWNAAVVAEQRRDYTLAKRYTERALALLDDGEISRDLPRLRGNFAYLLLCGDPAEPALALEQLDLAEPELKLLGSEVDLAEVDINRSRAHLLLGDAALAVAHARTALDRLAGQTRLENADAQVALGDALHALGDTDSAARAYSWAAEMLSMMTASRQSAAVWRDLGDRFQGNGEVARAAAAYDRALREAGYPANVPTPVRELWAQAIG